VSISSLLKALPLFSTSINKVSNSFAGR
jgi:hypothetical protein